MKKLSSYRDRVVEEFEKALKEDHTPRQTAASAALGTFITVIPTFGIGIVFFLLISRFFKSINKLALFACVIVFNPVMKYPIYIMSYSLGTILTDSEAPEEALETALASQATEAAHTMLLGNLVLAFILSIIAYFTIHKLAVKYDEKNLEITEELAEKI